ncbi:MAG TPA: CoA-binding protein [Verrucomicrobiales bacterium]|nr:CoA-binding protein [Verrucomicrobiales bacterium]
MKPAQLSVAVIGASDKPGRYSFQAVQKLSEHGHRVFPVTPRPIKLPGFVVRPSIAEVPRPIDTVTLYVNPGLLTTMAGGIIEAKPRRVIFNPGTEQAEIAATFEAAGIQVVEACTLVLLATGQFS